MVEKVLEEKMEKVMFEGDPGDEELRRRMRERMKRGGAERLNKG